MLKFFREIRQNLLREDPPAGRAGNKVRNYIFYARGKTLFVVIGI